MTTKLTNEQALQHTLQQAITAHQDDKLEDAEALYRSILKVYPQHPDANHNLGVLAVSLNQFETALPLLKTALECYPDQEQFWLSYIDALIKAKQFDNARTALNQGKYFEFSSKKLEALEAQLAQTSESTFNQINPDHIRSPSQIEVNALLEHYQTGQYDQAENLAKTIILKYPDYQLSWKILGTILQQTGRLQESLTAHQRAVEISPNDTQALNNLAVTLQELGRLEEAEASLRKAIAISPGYAEAYNNLGNTLQELDRLEEAQVSYNQALAIKPEYADILYNLGNALQKLGMFEEAERNYKKVIAIKPDLAIAHNNLGVTLGELGRLHDAEKCYIQALKIKPEYADAYYNFGVTLQELGRLEEAETNYRKAISITPEYVLAYNNIGVILQEMGRLKEAEASLRKAIAIKPDYAEALNNLAVTLQELGRLEEAEASLRKLIAIKPDYAEALNNLAVTLQELGRLEEALTVVIQSISIKPIVEAKNLFIEITKRIISIQSGNNFLAQFVTMALLEPWGRPAELMSFSCTLLKSNKEFGHLLNHFKDKDYQISYDKNLFSFISKGEFITNPLLSAMLSSAPIPDAEIELFLTALRHQLLQETQALTMKEVKTEIATLYCSLAQQCFINEYVYFQTPQEIECSQRMRDRLTKAIEDQQEIPALLVISVACYFPLHSVSGSKNLLYQNWSDDVKDVLKQQIQEPLEELNLHESLAVLTDITNQVSLTVQNQYEENPYPRWIRIPLDSNKKFLNSYIHKKFPLSSFRRLDNDKKLNILVAGCGTGQHSIDVSQLFMGAKILAVDLSKASLAYAMRKTAELDINSIYYAQADLLNLATIGQTFDVIESTGVLHHLENPFAGWKILISLLRPHGLMKIGLYSEVARRHIVRVHDRISKSGIGSSHQEIREYRKHLLWSVNSDDYGFITKTIDFFSISTCRDLLFHAQEHRMNLKVLDKFIIENDLNFLGFVTNSSIKNSYKKRFPNDPSATDLNNWHIYEKENPDTFTTMYQFWVQKK